MCRLHHKELISKLQWEANIFIAIHVQTSFLVNGPQLDNVEKNTCRVVELIYLTINIAFQ